MTTVTLAAHARRGLMKGDTSLYYDFVANFVLIQGLYYGFRDAILSHLVTASSAWCIMRYTVHPGLVSCPFYAIPIYPF